MPGREGWVRGRSDTEDVKIFLTGSSAQMLSREIGTKLTGRPVCFEVSPLSFCEFLRFKGLEASSELEYIANNTPNNYLYNILEVNCFQRAHDDKCAPPESLRNQANNRPTSIQIHRFLGTENVDTLSRVDSEHRHGLLPMGCKQFGEAEFLT